MVCSLYVCGTGKLVVEGMTQSEHLLTTEVAAQITVLATSNQIPVCFTTFFS